MRRVLKKGLAVALAAAMVVTLAPANADAAKKPSVPKTAKVNVGKTKKIKVKNGSKKAKVTWKSNKTKIAQVTKKTTKGNKATTIKGVKAGKAKITASYKLGKKKAKKLVCTVTVKGGPVNPTPTPVVTPTPAPTGPVNPTPGPSQTPDVTATPEPTPVVTPTPSARPKNKGPLEAKKAASGTTFTIDGVETSAEWEDVSDAEANDLLTEITKASGVRKNGTVDVEEAAKAIPVTEAKAKIIYSGKDLYVLLKVKGDSDKVVIYYDENKKASNDTDTTIEIPLDGAATSSNADYAVEAKAVKADGGYVLEAKITGKNDLVENENVNIDIQMNKGDVSVNFYDTRSAMVLDEETKEFALGDVEVKVGENADLLGPVNLGAQKPAATSALWTEFGAQILEESGIASAAFDMVIEPAGDDAQTGGTTNTKTVKYVDAKYWIDTYKDHGADSIVFGKVNIPDWRGNADHVGLADKTGEGDDAVFTTNRDYAQAYVMWDDDYLYVMFDVNDTDISPGNDDHYTTDSTELFLDEDGLCKEYDAAKDAVQLRIDAATNVFSSNDAGAGNYEVVGHAVGYKHGDNPVDDKIEGATGYQAQYIIKLHSKHQPNSFMGVELQINDCFTSEVDPDGNAWTDAEGNTTDADGNPIVGACRASTLTAYDTTNTAYENPELFERLKLLKKGVADDPVTPPDDPTPTPTPGGDDPNAPQEGWNEEQTEYTLKLDKTTIIKGQSWEAGDLNCTFNDDGSVKIIRNKEIGIQLPKDVYSAHKFTKVIINYKDSTNPEDSKFGYVAKYNSDGTSWAEGEENHDGWNSLSGSGTAELTPGYGDADAKLSGVRLYGGTENAEITITSIVFVK